MGNCLLKGTQSSPINPIECHQKNFEDIDIIKTEKLVKKDNRPILEIYRELRRNQHNFDYY